jgi:peptide chain release factor 1
MSDRFASMPEILAEYEELERKMADPSIHADQGKARQFGKRYAQLGPVIAGYKAWKSAEDDFLAAKELSATDPEFAAELPSLEAKMEESATILEDISVAVKSRGTPEAGMGPFAKLKFEGGVHRVQRVPETESQGRIHTSAAGVLVLPEAEEIDVEINMNDLRIDVYRSSGPGGQSVNTTDSAVRITHIPTGIVVSCQNEKSQLQNKESALRILRARLLAAAQEAADAEAAATRKSQVRTVDRSERIRTYNFPENRLSDHRVNYKSNNLDAVLNGQLDEVIQSLLDADKAEKLAAASA